MPSISFLFARLGGSLGVFPHVENFVFEGNSLGVVLTKLCPLLRHKLSSSFVGNVGIYSVGAKSVYQIVQSSRTECLAGVSREGLIHKILARHSCLHLY